MQDSAAIKDGNTDVAARVSRGDRAALRALYDALAGRVMAIGLALLKDRHEAEDLVQETFVDVWRRIGEFDPARGSVEAWVVSIARSRGIDRLRSRQSASRSVESLQAQPRDKGPTPPLELVQAGQDRASVRDALNQLPPEQRSVIELAYYEGLSQREIAEHSREPLGTVKTRIRLAMAKLGVSLAEAGVVP